MKKQGIFQAFTTLDIVLMAMLATANGAMTFYLSVVNKALNSLGGPIATSTITGLYMVYGLLAYYIIRKPGTAVITYALGAVVQSFIGTAYGITSVIAAAACYMVVAELVFALLRYRVWNRFIMMIAGAALVPIWFLIAARLFGYMEWGWNVLLIALAVRIVSGAVLCGLVSKLLGDALVKTGLLRRFAASTQGRA
ncbi:ECF transporter S component [Paenibacillus sp. JX-17]|uniref:ECF transporter S component n=1 Tax=Paenibacillus lacisoli TaxID=3064525 RepID=A0ABT9CKT1_9BACL|nr:ECF transporter S component [Paenibacillus sp. JX-17]MDO7908276.1 ECF transporter S component [Paenibacillus sp. JX-17]